MALAFDNLMAFYPLNDYLESDLAQHIMPKKTPKEPLRKKEAADKAKTKTSKKRFRLPRIPTLENANVLDLFANNDTNSTELSQSNYHIENSTAFPINHVDDAFLFLSQTEDFLKSIAKRVSTNQSNKAETEIHIEEDAHWNCTQQEDLDALVMESVTDNEFIASETLAQLLTKQGQVQRAIKMYQQLALQQPQKLAYFEQKIEELKTKK